MHINQIEEDAIHLGRFFKGVLLRIKFIQIY